MALNVKPLLLLHLSKAEWIKRVISQKEFKKGNRDCHTSRLKVQGGVALCLHTGTFLLAHPVNCHTDIHIALVNPEMEKQSQHLQSIITGRKNPNPNPNLSCYF